MDTNAARRNRAVWAEVNARFTDADADARWVAGDVTWGLFRRPERELALLGDVRGLDVVELGCGTAYLSAALAQAGARPVAVDLSGDQLATARRCQRAHGPTFPLVEADAERVPLGDATFDLAVSEYGAGPWCDPESWIPEAARLLRPGGRLVFLTNSVLAAMCVPADEGVAGDRLLRAQWEVASITWPGGGVEHHPSHSGWIDVLRRSGFVVDALHELFPPDDADDPEYYEIVGVEWANRWPAEDVWVAHRP
ncbi:MAG TPA: class I SAM-dependent methyltransferase [Acidimicrobiales bacterium]